MRSNFFTFKRDWVGETAFVLCGGTSVTDEQCALLAGRKVIAVNTMYRKVMDAPIMFFADMWWFREEKRESLGTWKAFKGLKVTKEVIQSEPNMCLVFWSSPTVGIATRPDSVALGHTSAQAAMNIAVHKGASRIVLVGVDNCRVNGRAHCHKEYPETRCLEEGWEKKDRDFSYTVEPLKKMGVEVLNASPISTLTFWPKCDLMEVL